MLRYRQQSSMSSCASRIVGVVEIEQGSMMLRATLQATTLYFSTCSSIAARQYRHLAHNRRCVDSYTMYSPSANVVIYHVYKLSDHM